MRSDDIAVMIVMLAGILTTGAAINFGNGVLAQKRKDGEPQGITADLSRELAKRLGVFLEVAT